MSLALLLRHSLGQPVLILDLAPDRRFDVKCFNHDAIDAVATCKNCSRALCRECAVDVGNGIACRNLCEQQVKALNAILKRGQNALRRSAWSMYGLAVFLLLIAAVIGQDALRTNEKGWSILGNGMALTFLGAAIFFFLMGKKAGTDQK